MDNAPIGNDGLTDDERTALAEKYAKAAGSMTPEQVRATIQRVKERRKAS